MNLLYRIYSNDGRGGIVNFSAPIATTPSLTYSTPPLAAGADTTFVVRAFDSDSGLEEANTDARVRIIVDANGNDVTSQPNAPRSLFARPTAAGGCLVSWIYSTNAQGGAPLGFNVYLSQGSTPNYSSFTATVPYLPGVGAYACNLSGLINGTQYTISVRAYNSISVETNTSAVTSVVGDTIAPSQVDMIRIAQTFRSS
jgi:hypothetical protein